MLFWLLQDEGIKRKLEIVPAELHGRPLTSSKAPDSRTIVCYRTEFAKIGEEDALSDIQDSKCENFLTGSLN